MSFYRGMERPHLSMKLPHHRMKLAELPLPAYFREHPPFSGLTLTPIQEKAVKAGLLQGKSLLCCAPTASGKTLIASLAIATILSRGKAIYLVPLKALAGEKFREYQRLLQGTAYRTILSIGDIDSDSSYLVNYDLLILTTEKLDSLLRHHVPWLNEVKLVVVDEIHLLHDPSRGPTLEVVLTLLRTLIQPQIIGLSATVGNPRAMADWLKATLVTDSWRPVELKQGIHCQNETEFY